VPKLTLYGKAGCHLCDDARAVVASAVAGRDVSVEEVDITMDPVLHRRLGERIPVLELDGEQLFELFVDAAGLVESLDRVGA